MCLSGLRGSQRRSYPLCAVASYDMRLNDKNVASFAVCSSPIDKEGYLSKKTELGKGYQRRWFVLKGNLLFYFEKKQDKEPVGLIVLEACSVQASAQVQHAFEISFDGQGTRTYVLLADNDVDMQSWMKVISHASYEYLRTIVDELQRRVNLLTSSSSNDDLATSDMSLLRVGPSKGAPTPRRVQSTKETSTRVAVQNGILVDMPEQAPPIPAKKKSMTLASGKRSLLHSQDTHETSLDLSHVPVPSQHRDVQQMRTLPPHSSPVVTSQVNPKKPLSPMSTLDRTPVLQPTIVTSDGSKVTADSATTGNGVAECPLQTRYSGLEERLVDQATSHPSSGAKRQIAAPLDPKKTIYEMHEEFTQAMTALRTERNGGSPS